MMGARAYGGFNNPTWEHLRDWQDIFSGIFAYGRWSFNLAPGAEAPPVNGNYVSGRYFDTLGVHAALGRTLTRTDDTRGCAGNAVLSYRFWQQEFGGNPNVVGRAISIDRHPIPVVGVAQPGFDGVEVGGSADLILPLCAVTLIRNGDSSLLDINYLPVGWLQVMGRLKPENLRRASQGTPESAGDLQSHSLGSGNASGRWPPMAARTSDQFLKGTFDIEPAANGISYLRREYR